MSFAEVEDLIARWRKLNTDEVARATVLIEDVTVYITARLDCSGVKLDPENENQVKLLKIITCDVVKRVMQTPIDTPPVTAMQQTAGTYQGSLTFANPSGDKYLTAEEMRLLGIKKKRQSIGTIAPMIGGNHEPV